MTSIRINYSSNLQSNFKQMEVASADYKFEALQTYDGHALLFSIGSNGVMYVTEETPGHLTGWIRTDLSSRLAEDFQGQPIKARTFAVAQNRDTSSIDMAAVIQGPAHDNLYLCMGNSSDDTTWIGRPKWVLVPYDDPLHPLAQLRIVNVAISQASDGEYIVVDVLRNPDGSRPVVFRYSIDPTKKLSGHAWNSHDVANDLDASKYMSCLGRRKGERVDGIYTLGSLGEHDSLVYQPLFNIYNPKIAPNPSCLLLPSGSAPSAIAAATVGEHATSLFVACEQALYYFPHDQQHDGAQAIEVFRHPIFKGVSRLFAFATAKTMIVWGLNGAGKVFYTTCAHAHLQDPEGWSYPLPILENVQQISPYVNRANDGNTFFAHTGVNQLQRAVQTPTTSIWTFDSITLPASTDSKATKLNSYTTRVQVTDERNLPLAGAPVHISSTTRASVYINNSYYVLDSTPISISTDQIGGLTIVEWVSSLQAACLRVHQSDGSIISINPMDMPMQKAAQLDSSDKLAAATVAVGPGKTRHLIDPAVGDAERQNIVDVIASLARTYQTLPQDGSSRSMSTVATRRLRTFGVAQPTQVGASGAATVLSVSGPADAIGDSIEVLAGDLFQFLDSATDYAIQIVEDVGAEVWTFVAEIAGQSYHCVLDAAAKVLGALEYVFAAVKTVIQDLIEYLEFRYDWMACKRTKDVYKKLLLMYYDLLLDDIKVLKEKFNACIADVKNSADNWAGIKQDDWQFSVENGHQTMGYPIAITRATEMLTAPSMFLFNHLFYNVSNSQSKSDASVDVVDDLLNRAVRALQDEGGALLDAANRIKAELLAGAQYESLPLGEVLKRITAIVVDAVLNSSENLVDLLLDVLVTLARGVIAALDDPVWIPVVSDILADAFPEETDLSMLDAILMVGAIPATLVYQGIHGFTPFSSRDSFSSKIIEAKDVYELRDALELAERIPSMATLGDGLGKEESSFMPIKLDPKVQEVIFTVGHLISGVVALMASPLDVATAAAEGASGPSEYVLQASAAVSLLGYGLAAVFAQPCPIQNQFMYFFSEATTGLTLLVKVVFAAAPRAMVKSRGLTDGDQIKALKTKVAIVGTGLDAAIALFALLPTVYHLFELSTYPAGDEPSEAVVDEASNICYHLSRIARLAAAIDKEPDSKAIIVTAMGVLLVMYAALQMGEAMLGVNQ